MLHHIKKIFDSGFIVMLIFLLLAAPAGINFGNAFAQSQNECEEELKTAQKKMETGRFDEAIELITKCLNKEGINNETKKQAYRLLGLTYIAKDYLGEARNAIGKLLDVVPNYQPDPNQDPPSFVDIVEEQIAERSQSEPPAQSQTAVSESDSDMTMWYWIGGGVIVVAVAAILLLGGGDDEGGGDTPTGLPGPPNLP